MNLCFSVICLARSVSVQIEMLVQNTKLGNILGNRNCYTSNIRKTAGLLMCFILKPFGFLLVIVLTGKTLLFQIEGKCIK